MNRGTAVLATSVQANTSTSFQRISTSVCLHSIDNLPFITSWSQTVTLGDHHELPPFPLSYFPPKKANRGNAKFMKANAMVSAHGDDLKDKRACHIVEPKHSLSYAMKEAYGIRRTFLGGKYDKGKGGDSPKNGAEVVPVKQRYNTWQVHMDFSSLNKVCPKDMYPFPKIEENWDHLSGININASYGSQRKEVRTNSSGSTQRNKPKKESFGPTGLAREVLPIGMPRPTNGSNVEANLHGPLGLSKWASIFGGIFIRDPLSYEYEILFKIPDVDLVSLGLEFHLGLKPFKCDTDFDAFVQCGVNHDHVLHVYSSSIEFDLNEQNNDSGSELDDDDYNVYDYASSTESDTASIDHLSKGERFKDPEQLKRALAFYALANGYKLYYEVNNPRRLAAKCSKDNQEKKCPFRNWKVVSNGESRFEVRNRYEGFKVDKRWNEWKDQWPITSYQKPLPPIKKRMPGRPPYKRKIDFSNKDGNRSRINRKGQVNHYTLCGESGHNQRACPSKGLDDSVTGVNPPPMSARGGKRSAKGGKTPSVSSRPSSPSVGFEMSTPTSPSPDVRLRGGVYIRGNSPIKAASTKRRGRVDEETMLGNNMGLPRAAWPAGITPEDVRIHA
nr:hypothetical protein [Tanacetum cinerariifolium]